MSIICKSKYNNKYDKDKNGIGIWKKFKMYKLNCNKIDTKQCNINNLKENIYY